ncbi:MAG: thrombospondin type 3 repeat-containing protein [Planctomycetota bacterium]
MPRITTLVSVMSVSAALTAAHAGPPVPPGLEADLNTPFGAQVIVTADLSVTSDLLGTSSDTDVQTVSVAANRFLGVTPDVTPGAGTSLENLVVSFGNVPFTFELFCLPFIGCQTLTVDVENLVLTQVGASCASLDASQDVTYAIDISAIGTTVIGGIVMDTVPIDFVEPSAISANVTESAFEVTLSNLGVAPLNADIPPADLPAGFSAVSLTITIDFLTTTLEGTGFAPPFNLDMDEDGVLNVCDNCPDVMNADQADGDMNGIGDACEVLILPCPADCAPDNGDGTFGNGLVNIDDLLAVINAFGSAGGPCDNAPDNGDGTFGNDLINIDDLLGVINAFGACP